MKYDPLYLQGIAHFNAHEFFEAHDAWEELWTDFRGPGREFFKGLIQTAVALHHFGNRNLHGARKLYHSSRAYLDPYRPSHLGLDLHQFLLEFDQCFADVAASDDDKLPICLVPDLIPTITLDP